MRMQIAHLMAAIVVTASACAESESGPAFAQPASTPPVPATALEDTYWKVTTIAGAPVVVPKNQRAPQLLLNSADRTLSAFGGCNQMSGTYQVEGEKLTLSRMASTMMACLNGMEQEQALHDALNRVARWQIRDDSLELLDSGGETVATLAPN